MRSGIAVGSGSPRRDRPRREAVDLGGQVLELLIGPERMPAHDPIAGVGLRRPPRGVEATDERDDRARSQAGHETDRADFGRLEIGEGRPEWAGLLSPDDLDTEALQFGREAVELPGDRRDVVLDPDG